MPANPNYVKIVSSIKIPAVQSDAVTKAKCAKSKNLSENWKFRIFWVDLGIGLSEQGYFERWES
jgi:hypothetical protein